MPRASHTPWATHVSAQVLFAALTALAISPGCCDDAECTDSVSIAINTRGGPPLPNGRYVLEANLDGTPVRGECSLDDKTICTSDRVSLARGAVGLTFAGIRGAPKHLDLTISRESTVILTTSFDPQYSKSWPNGEECGPTCMNATAVAATK